LSAEGDKVRRRRECPHCNARFTTYEIAELLMPPVVKRDGRREPFLDEKLRTGLLRALEKRPVSAEQIEETVLRIKNRARASGERELSSQQIGEWVMDELRNLDQVAYVRFASVYRSFEDVNAFREEIERLQQTPDARWIPGDVSRPLSSDDYRFMARALTLARRGLYSTDPNPRVGCVLVREGAVVGEGWHQRAGEPHAEVNALERRRRALARGATAYVTLEPCCHHGRTPPCTDALLNAGVSRLVAAMPDPNPQVAGAAWRILRDAGVAVDCGLLEAEAQALNPGFIQRMTTGRPFRPRQAGDESGRAHRAGFRAKVQWLTGEAARQDVQRLRARSSAILTGIGTVLADDPSLNVRLPEADRQPLRVILDSGLRTPPTARTLRLPGSVLIFTAVADPASQRRCKLWARRSSWRRTLNRV
jgi:riboflavin biosynthesis protein RibD/transcriptional regulator NrdR